MSTPSARRGRRRAWLVATLLGAFGLFLTLGAGNAFAAGCSVNASGGGPATVAGPNYITVSLGNETGTLSVGSLSHINLNGIWCAPATTSNTDLINVIGSGAPDSPTGGDTLVIDESGGYFQPGKTAETAGTNEIEFLLGTPGAVPVPLPGGGGTYDPTAVENVVINGNASPDHVFIGDGLLYPGGGPELGTGATFAAGPPPTFTLGPPLVDNQVPAGSWGIINLNGDGDADVFLASSPFLDEGLVNGYPFIQVDGNGGGDDIEGVGTHGTGDAVGAFQFANGGPVDPQHGLFITGGPGDDTLIGGSGDDTFQTGAGNDTVDGGESNEDLFLGSACVSLIDSQGNPDLLLANGDTIDYSASTGPDTVDLDPNEHHPGAGNKPDGIDVLQNIENVVGSPANDTLSGDNNDNVLVGGGGDDKIAGDAGDDCEFGQAGNDTFDENEGTSLAQGGTGFSNGSDLMLGGAGLDDMVDYSSRPTRIDVYLEPLPFFPSLVGGSTAPGCVAFEQIDLTRAHNRQAQGASFVFAPDGADVNGDGDAADALDEFDCVFLDTENAMGGTNNDILDGAFTGNRSDNEFWGNAGNDLEVGGAGNDTFHEGTAPNGADDMDGGTGSDTCDYSQRTGNLNVSIDGSDNDGEAGEGDNCGGVFAFDRVARGVHGFAQPSGPQNVENILGGSGADVLTGDDDQNILNGDGGNDVLSGLGGPDTLLGGDGDDVLSPGQGNDAADGGNGTDTLDESSAGVPGIGVSVNLTTGQLSGDGNDTLTGLENATGSSFPDKLTGDAGNNVLNGRGGADAIQGKAGDDTVNGGEGNDELGGGAGNDAIDGGRGSDAARGGSGDDTVNGGPGADTLFGGGGDDVLNGGANRDHMNGGPGTDRCRPGAPGFGHGDVAVNCES